MRLLHTADWHLGQTFHEQSRSYEHRQFLSWLLDTLEDERIDALLIAGDVFDSPNPSAEAQALWYGFLSEASTRLPHLRVVAIAGNHDSGDRLEAPSTVLAALRVHVVGGYFRSGEQDLERLILPLHDRSGEIAAWVAAIPFLRQGDVPSLPDTETEPALVAGVRHRYDTLLATARARRGPRQALIAMGHCYMVGTNLSEVSEKKIQIGNQHALPHDLFGEDISYVALGHLHRAQAVGGRETVRYSGSPLPMSMAERNYAHQVVLFELDGPEVSHLQPIPVPRAVDLQQLPTVGPAASLQDVLRDLRALPGVATDTPSHLWPYLEVRVSLAEPVPDLLITLREALEGKAARLVSVQAEKTGHGQALASVTPASMLQELDVEQVFRQCYQRHFKDEPSTELLSAFHTLLERVREEG